MGGCLSSGPQLTRQDHKEQPCSVLCEPVQALRMHLLGNCTPLTPSQPEFQVRSGVPF